MEPLKVSEKFLIDRLSAERAILTVGKAFSSAPDKTIVLIGRNDTTGLPQKREITTNMIQEPIDRFLDVIVTRVARQIQHAISTLSSDVTFENKIILNGE